MNALLLDDKELISLKGGQANINSNTVNYCICWYNNKPIKATNDNGQPYCDCKCINKN
jgi:hypothetical protein